MDETVIITFSPKYKTYQQRILAGQIDRAVKIMLSPDKSRKAKNPNDPSRFIQKTAVTGDGEIAQKQVYQLDEERIREEAMYDGFYAVVTNLEDDVREIISINKRPKLTDALHTAFGFRTDYKFISKADMRAIIKETKQKNSTISKIVQYRCKNENSHTPNKH